MSIQKNAVTNRIVECTAKRLTTYDLFYDPTERKHCRIFRIVCVPTRRSFDSYNMHRKNRQSWVIRAMCIYSMQQNRHQDHWYSMQKWISALKSILLVIFYSSPKKSNRERNVSCTLIYLVAYHGRSNEMRVSRGGCLNTCVNRLMFDNIPQKTCWALTNMSISQTSKASSCCLIFTGSWLNILWEWPLRVRALVLFVVRPKNAHSGFIFWSFEPTSFLWHWCMLSME